MMMIKVMNECNFVFYLFFIYLTLFHLFIVIILNLSPSLQCSINYNKKNVVVNLKILYCCVQQHKFNVIALLLFYYSGSAGVQKAQY